MVKKARAQQTVAACILRHCTGGQGHRYLLVKRAEKGLLAGDPTSDTYQLLHQRPLNLVPATTFPQQVAQQQ